MSEKHTPEQLKELAEAARRMPWDTSETDVPFEARYAFRKAITADHYLEVLGQRDELLEALQSFMVGAEAMGWDTTKAVAAIAKAKGAA